MIYIGADPGASGAIAYEDTLRQQVICVPMPQTRQDLAALLRGLAETDRCVCLVEKVGPMKGDGASTGAAFATAVERLGCCLELIGIRTLEWSPVKWQKATGVQCPGLPPYPKGVTAQETKAVRARRRALQKDYSYQIAQQRWPHCETPLNRKLKKDMADALHLLEACKIAWRDA